MLKRSIYKIIMYVFIVSLFFILSGCSNKNDNIIKFINNVDQVIETKDISSLYDLSFEDKPLSNSDINNSNLEYKIKEMIDVLYNDGDSYIEALSILENYKIGYNNQKILNYLNNNYWKSLTSEDKVNLYLSTAENSFYKFDNVDSNDFDSYPEDKRRVFYSLSNRGGYYDSIDNHEQGYNRKIMSNGDIVSVSYSYYGDFSIESKDREYLDSYYQIHHDYSKEMYFKGCNLHNLGTIDKMLYIDGYLISYTESDFQVYKLIEENNKCISSTYINRK